MYMCVYFLPTSPTDTRPTLLQLTHLVTPSGKTMEIIKPANWATLVRVLRDAEFSVLAGELEQVVPTLVEGGREGGGGEC